MSKRYSGIGIGGPFYQPPDPLRMAFSIGKYETRSRLDCGNIGTTFPSGNVCLTPIWFPSGLAISSLTFISGSTAGASLTHTWFSIHDSALALLAETTDDTSTSWATNTAKTFNIGQIASGSSSTFTTTYEGVHYISPIVVGTTIPTFVCGGNLGQGAGTIQPYLGVCNTGYSSRPAFPVTLSAPTQSGPLLYGYAN